MLNTLVSAILTEFTFSTLAFTHYDVAACIANLSLQQVGEIERLVFHKMTQMPAYRISLVYFAGEGLTFLYSPLHSIFSKTLADLQPVEEPRLAI